MVETVYLGTLIPLVFLMVSVTEGNRRLIGFLMAGLSSALIAFYVNNAIANAFQLEQSIMVTRVVPIVEETLKLLPLFAVFFMKAPKSNYEIVRNALACGIGFSILENFYYILQYSPEGVGTAIGFIIVRSISASLLHGVATALSGYCIQQLRIYRYFSLPLVLGSLGAAILVHSLFNYLAVLPGLGLLCVLVPLPIFFIEFYGFNFFGRKPSRILVITAVMAAALFTGCSPDIPLAGRAVFTGQAAARSEKIDGFSSVLNISSDEDGMTAVDDTGYTDLKMENSGTGDLVINDISIYREVFIDGELTDAQTVQNIFGLAEGTKPELPLTIPAGGTLDSLRLFFKPVKNGLETGALVLETSSGPERLKLTGTGAWKLTLIAELSGGGTDQFGKIVKPIEVLIGENRVYRAAESVVALMAETTHPLDLWELDQLGSNGTRRNTIG